jgi:hypothetical protein
LGGRRNGKTRLMGYKRAVGSVCITPASSDEEKLEDLEDSRLQFLSIGCSQNVEWIEWWNFLVAWYWYDIVTTPDRSIVDFCEEKRTRRKILALNQTFTTIPGRQDWSFDVVERVKRASKYPRLHLK